MADEKRLIDANALIAEYDRVHIGPPGGARKLMEDAQTVDAVEVVRCVHCKHLGIKDFVYGYCKNKMCGFVKPDDFCSYGERKS